ncbi:ligand-binding sensor domain-containing protein [Ferruginibacter sp.]|nr:transcriptional regulator [Ferruginibacter sp.]
MKKCFTFFLLLVVHHLSPAQNTIGLPLVVNYNNSDFKGGLQTWDIKQDKSGKMYFANNEGLISYDGSYWKVYPQPNKTILRSIAIDANNKIYAGGQDEIGFYFPDANGILRYTSLKNLIPPAQNKFADIWDIEIFKESVFFRTPDRIFEYKNQAIKVYPAPSNWQIIKVAGNKLLAQDKATGLFEFVNNSWQPVATPNLIPDFVITGIVPLGTDSLLISSLQNGLYIFSRGVITKKNTAADNSFQKNNIYSFEQINASEFAAGTTSDGCLIINRNGEIIQQIARPEGLQNNNVLSVFLDKDRNLWAGLNNGISFIAYNSAIKYIKPSKTNDVSGYSCRVFNNQLYIATSDGAYAAPLSNTNKDISFSKADFITIQNSGGQAWRLDEVNHQLLMGHHNGCFVIQNNTAIQLTSGVGIWLFVPTTSIYPATNILTGTYYGLTMLECTNGNFTSNYTLKGISESIRFLAIDNNDDIWASHPYRGIYKLILSADNKSYTAQLFTDKDGLPSAFRNHVFRVKNRVIFATEKGLYEFDASLKKFIPSPLLYNVFGDIGIQYLNEDAEGNLWFCSGKKIGVVNFSASEKKSTITYFPELTGKILAGFENVYPFTKENVFIAADNGIIHLNYEKYLANNSKLNVLLTQVKAFGKTDSIIFGGYFLQNKDSSYTQNNNSILRFPISNNSFHFEFSSPAFSLQKNIEYSYQLEGFENKWSEWTIKTEKDYTNLPNGTYTFKVKAHDNLGNESEVISYSFIVQPAWYKTIWAYLFYILFILFSFYLLDKWQKKKLRIQQLKFEEEQKRLKYIHQLEVEKNEKEIIKLQNEKLANEVIYKNKELADVSMHLVERSDALIKVKDELQQLYKKTGGNHDVKKAIQLVNDIEKNNSNWEQFATHFDEVNNDLLKKLKSKFPALTNTDLKVCAYLQLKLSSKEIAQLMNISVRGVEISRYRLRKKLQLPTEQTLNDFLREILRAD